MGGPGVSRDRRPRSIDERQVRGNLVSEKSYRGGRLLPPYPWPHTRRDTQSHSASYLVAGLRSLVLMLGSKQSSPQSHLLCPGSQIRTHAVCTRSRPPPAPCDLCISQTQVSGHFPSMSAEGPAPPLPCLKSLTSYSSFSLAGMAKMAPVHLWQSWSDSPRRPIGVTGSGPSRAQTGPEASCPSSQHWEGCGKTVRSSKPAKATE